MKTRGVLTGAAVALVASVLASGIAGAGIPGAGSVINGCYQKVEGQLRVVDPGTDDCRPSELAITWNQEGGQGEPGEPGAPGGDGADGRDGVSATVVPEPVGANCATGGAKVTAASGVTYVCSALPPDPGGDG